MNKKTVLIVVGVAAVLCVCCFAAIVGIGVPGGIGAFGLTQPAADVGEKFIKRSRVAIMTRRMRSAILRCSKNSARRKV